MILVKVGGTRHTLFLVQRNILKRRTCPMRHRLHTWGLHVSPQEYQIKGGLFLLEQCISEVPHLSDQPLKAQYQWQIELQAFGAQDEHSSQALLV